MSRLVCWMKAWDSCVYKNSSDTDEGAPIKKSPTFIHLGPSNFENLTSSSSSVQLTYTTMLEKTVISFQKKLNFPCKR